MAPAFHILTSEGQMAMKTTPYTLQRGREQEFRRTVNYFTTDKDGNKVLDPKRESVQFRFIAGEDVQLTDEEIEFMETDIKAGFIVRADRDAKGRQRVQRDEPTPEAADIIAKLEKKVEDLSAKLASVKAENKKLTADLEAATAPK